MDRLPGAFVERADAVNQGSKEPPKHVDVVCHLLPVHLSGLRGHCDLSQHGICEF